MSGRQQNLIRIGLHELEITPPFATALAGFGQARTANHEGVHDPLHASCVVFENADEVVALVSCEVIGLNAGVIRQVREALARACDFPAERLVITCTHTHGAPVIHGEFIPYLIERLVRVIRTAWEDRRPRRLVAGRGSHSEWVGFNRRNLEAGFLPVDREVVFMGVLEPSGETRAVLYHYACHPSILGPGNLLITADWPGYARQSFRRQLGADIAVLYLKGLEGDINSGYSAGISSLGIPIPTRTYETAERAGSVVAGTVLQAWDHAEEMSDPRVQFVSRQVDVRYQETSGLENATEMVDWWQGEVQRVEASGRPERHVLGALVEHAYARFRLSTLEQIAAAGNRTLQVEQIAFRVGGAGFLSFPGEFFVSSGLQVKHEARAAFAFPLGIANDYQGYFPPAVEFPYGGYEVACAKFSLETADAWTSSGVQLLNSLFGHQ